MAAATTSKLVNIARNPSLRKLIHRNLLRAPAISTTTPISQTLSPAGAYQFPILFKSESPVSCGMMGLPGIDRSGMSLKYGKNKQRPVSDDDVDDDMDDGDLDSYDGSDVDDFVDDYSDDVDGDDSD